MDIEKTLKIISDMQQIAPDDELTKIINENSNIELDESELDIVFAASKQNNSDFIKFTEKIENSRRNK